MPATSRRSPALDDWLPEFHVRTHHARTSRAAPDELWEAARAVEVRETRSLRTVIGWRLGRYAPRADDTLYAVLTRFPFQLLEEQGRVSISGVAGPLWAVQPRFEEFGSPEEFRDWSRGGSCKVVIRHEVRDHARGSEIVSDARVWCTSRGAALRFRPFWALVSPASRYIGGELLAAAVRRAERSSSATS